MTKTKQRKKETHVENRTQKRRKKKRLSCVWVVFDYQFATFGFYIYPLFYVFGTCTDVLFFACIFIPIF